MLFRNLSLADLPAIQALSDSMDIRNSPNIGENAESLVQDSKCILYGAFREDILVGVGGFRDKGKKLAWIEDVRVHGEYQRIGIGTQLIQYGVDLARKRGYQHVGYQTVTENLGACHIGEKLGFQRKQEMAVFHAYPADLLKNGRYQLGVEKISNAEALHALKRIPNAPKDEISIGWSFAPISIEYFDSEPDMRFYVHNDTIMLEIDERNLSTHEIKVVKAILYGAKDDVDNLLSEFIACNVSRELPLMFLCPKELVPDVLPSGFQRATVWTNGPNIVVLFIKDL